MARMRTDSGKTFNMRGLERQAGSANYEFAYMTDGVGSNSAAKAKVPQGTVAKARRSGANLPSRSGQ